MTPGEDLSAGIVLLQQVVIALNERSGSAIRLLNFSKNNKVILLLRLSLH